MWSAGALLPLSRKTQRYHKSPSGSPVYPEVRRAAACNQLK
jgi:hypothetical protein